MDFSAVVCKDASAFSIELCILSFTSASILSDTKEFVLVFLSKLETDQSTLLDGKFLSISSVALARTLCISSWIFQDPVVGVSLFGCIQISTCWICKMPRQVKSMYLLNRTRGWKYFSHMIIWRTWERQKKLCLHTDQK